MTTRPGSGSQRLASLATPTGDDRAPRASAHPQPEAVHARTTPIVRLKGPLALGHGCLSSLHLAAAAALGQPRQPLVSSASCSYRRVHPPFPGNVGFAAVSPTFGRLFEGTDVRSLGQTCASTPTSHRRGLPHNVAERLALRDKTVSFWQCRSHRDGPQTTKQGYPVVQRE